MFESESFQIDMGDPNDVRAKVPRAREILAKKEAALKEQTEDVAEWRVFVQLLERRAGSPDEAASTAGNDETDDAASTGESKPEGKERVSVDFTGVETVLDGVVRTVNEQNRPIRSREVAELLRREGNFEGLQNDTVSNSLYYAAERAEPPRVRKMAARGVYAPLETTAGGDDSVPVQRSGSYRSAFDSVPVTG